MIAVGLNHVMLLTDNQVFSWGDGSKAQLGHNDTQSLSEPKILSLLTKHTIMSIYAGGNQSAFLNGK